jgi:hypothetical protein
VAGDHGARMKCFDRIERHDPLTPTLRARLGEVQVHVVVGRVPGDDQVDGGHVEAGRVVSVSVPQLHYDQVVAFELECAIGEGVSYDDPIGKLARKPRAPELLERIRGGLPAHEGHNAGRCNGLRFWEALENETEAEEMIPVPMGDIDRRQVPALRGDPLNQSLGLVDRHQRVD